MDILIVIFLPIIAMASIICAILMIAVSNTLQKIYIEIRNLSHEHNKKG